MKRTILVLLGAFFLATPLAGCTVSPDAGEEAVLIKKPLIFGHGGVAEEPVATGLAIVAPTTRAVYVDMKPTEWRVPFDDLMTKDGVPLDFEASITVQVTDSVKVIEKFGEKWFLHNVETTFRNLVRQAVRKYGMNEVAIDTIAIEAIDNEVTTKLETYLKSEKLPVRLVRMTVGKANPPKLIKDQRVETANEEQREKTQAKTQAAEISRKNAEQARAEADNAYRTAMNLSPAQFVELQKIEALKTVCTENKCTFIQGDSPVLVGAK